MMVLESELTFTDAAGREWTAPAGARLNGATIPRALWTSVGPPFVGPYRRASVVHDYFVGENGNPKPPTQEARSEADRMFYEACLFDGCSKRFAATLYAGVRFGSWMAKEKSSPRRDGFPDLESPRERIQHHFDEQRFWKMIEKLDSAVEEGDLEAIDAAFPKPLL